MKTEKILIFLLAVCQVLSLAACTQKADEFQPARAAVFCHIDAAESDTALYMALDTALNSTGLIYRKNNAASQQSQLEQIDTAIGEGYSLLIVDLIDEDDKIASEVIGKAQTAEIGLIFMGDVPKEILAGYEKAFCVFSDNVRMEAAQGEMIGTYLLANFEEADLNGDGVITYLLLGEGATALRKAEQVLADGSLATLRAYEAKQEDIMMDALQNCSVEDNNMIECVVADSDDKAMEALRVLQQAGYNSEGQIRICIFGIGGTAQARNGVDSGFLTGTVYANLDGVAQTISGIALSLAQEGTLPDEQYMSVPYAVCVQP